MKFTDYVVISGMALIAAGFTAIGWAIRMVSTTVDEAVWLVKRRQHG